MVEWYDHRPPRPGDGLALTQGKEVIVVPSFDVADLRKHGVTITPLPDERGQLIDVHTLPARFTERLRQDGLDTSKPVRVVGVIARRPGGAPGPYLIRFEQA
jgi:hypothetical protein